MYLPFLAVSYVCSLYLCVDLYLSSNLYLWVGGVRQGGGGLPQDGPGHPVQLPAMAGAAAQLLLQPHHHDEDEDDHDDGD